jgi:hypothetical protein
MTLCIIDRGDLLDGSLRQLAERRLLFALSRFDSRIEQVDLVVSDENGPRGGIDKACRLSIVLHRAPQVVISDRDSDLAKCISRVAERAGRAVSRSIEKSRSFDRSRPPFQDSSTPS